MRIGDKTQVFQPLKTPLANISSYYRYRWKHNPGWKRTFLTVIMVAAAISLVLDVLDFFNAAVWIKLLSVVGFVFPAVLNFLDFTKHYEEKFTSIETDETTYQDVAPPGDDWKMLLLRVSGKNEPVYTNDQIDKWLRGNQQKGIVRDKDYEDDLKKVIRNQDLWDKIFALFLRHKHREAMYKGEQFYNESKFGLSTEFCPEVLNDEHTPDLKVHRSCYFDTYLTNIIPGKHLISNRDGTVVAETYPDLMPYHIDTNENRRLYLLGEKRTSNELGVSTLCILPNGFIRLWRQNRMAQCSNDLFMASGSGSADWNDCKKYFKDPNGLRKAIVHGMERELWEESNGTRENDVKDFCDKVDTRITGYFRWLKKGGKSEFVGVSRLRDTSLLNKLAPEKSEVNLGTDLPAGTMQKLIDSLEKEVHVELDGQSIVSERCNVSCSMAILALKSICRAYCREKCPNYDKNRGCCAGECGEKPYNILFSDKESPSL